MAWIATCEWNVTNNSGSNKSCFTIECSEIIPEWKLWIEMPKATMCSGSQPSGIQKVLIKLKEQMGYIKFW